MDWMIITGLAGAGACALLCAAQTVKSLLNRQPSKGANLGLKQLEDAVRDARFAYELEEETGNCPVRLKDLLLAFQQAEVDLEAAKTGKSAEIAVPVDLRPKHERFIGRRGYSARRFDGVAAIARSDQN